MVSSGSTLFAKVSVLVYRTKCETLIEMFWLSSMALCICQKIPFLNDTGPGNKFFPNKKYSYFSYLSMKSYIVGILRQTSADTFLISHKSIGFGYSLDALLQISFHHKSMLWVLIRSTSSSFSGEIRAVERQPRSSELGLASKKNLTKTLTNLTSRSLM